MEIIQTRVWKREEILPEKETKEYQFPRSIKTVEKKKSTRLVKVVFKSEKA